MFNTDDIKDFALPARQLFPCDSPDLLNASLNAFEREASKLPVTEKTAAARHMTKRAAALKVPCHDKLAARISGDKLNDMFKAALRTRVSACAWAPEAIREVNRIEKLGSLIADLGDGLRLPLLDKLAAEIEAFDTKWDTKKCWGSDVPDACETVFAREAEELGVVTVGQRQVRASDLAAIDKTAAAQLLAPDALAATGSFDAFAAADDMTKALIVSLMAVRQ